jgi:NAD(P)-dependent dehydrogenase (short-subunit alcohol dehydrogenase family)
MGEMDGKVVLVTGAGSGIGRETALRFAREGARVAAVDVDEESVQRVARVVATEDLIAAAFRCDVTSEREVADTVTAVVQRFGRLDALVNSAGISIGEGRTGDTAPEVWHKTIAVNLTGSFLASRFAIPAMLANGGGSIVNMGSIYGLSGLTGDVAYAASKGGVIQLTRTIALEYARRGIRVNCICPGFVETPLLTSQTGGLPPEAVGKVSVPMGRLATPADIAETALFLASDRAAFITGAIISVDGGMSAR